MRAGTATLGSAAIQHSGGRVERREAPAICSVLTKENQKSPDRELQKYWWKGIEILKVVSPNVSMMVSATQFATQFAPYTKLKTQEIHKAVTTAAPLAAVAMSPGWGRHEQAKPRAPAFLIVLAGSAVEPQASACLATRPSTAGLVGGVARAQLLFRIPASHSQSLPLLSSPVASLD